MTNEEWRPVVGWEGFYEVSSFGRVKSLPRSFYRKGHRISVRERILKLNPLRRRSGHMLVGLHKDGNSQTKFVHRLVCEAFHGPAPEGKPLVLHWDDSPTNNASLNLRWGNAAENSADRLRNSARIAPAITYCPRGHPYDEANTYVNPKGFKICRTCRREAQRRSRG